MFEVETSLALLLLICNNREEIQRAVLYSLVEVRREDRRSRPLPDVQRNAVVVTTKYFSTELSFLDSSAGWSGMAGSWVGAGLA